MFEQHLPMSSLLPNDRIAILSPSLPSSYVSVTLCCTASAPHPYFPQLLTTSSSTCRTRPDTAHTDLSRSSAG